MRKLWLLLPFLGACMAPLPREGGDWRTSETFQKPYDDVWKACISALEQRGFKISNPNKADRRMETLWRTQMSPRFRESVREKMEVEIVEAETGRGLVVRIRSTREVNDNSQNPSSEKDADWQNVGGNDAAADEICFLLKMKLKGVSLDD